MSRYFAVDPLTGKYGDIVCRRHPQGPQWYSVTVGTFPIGSVVAIGNHGWDAISDVGVEMLRGQRSVQGFRTRWDAIEYLLMACGIHDRHDRYPRSETEGTPIMVVLTADPIEQGDAVTVCQVEGSDIIYVRQHRPDDGVIRPAPDDVHTLGEKHYIEELCRRGRERRERAEAEKESLDA